MRSMGDPAPFFGAGVRRPRSGRKHSEGNTDRMDGNGPCRGNPNFARSALKPVTRKTGKETNPYSSRPWNPAAGNGVRAGWPK